MKNLKLLLLIIGLVTNLNASDSDSDSDSELGPDLPDAESQVEAIKEKYMYPYYKIKTKKYLPDFARSDIARYIKLMFNRAEWDSRSYDSMEFTSSSYDRARRILLNELHSEQFEKIWEIDDAAAMVNAIRKATRNFGDEKHPLRSVLLEVLLLDPEINDDDGSEDDDY